jgi:alkaline phosphatase
MKVRWSSKNHSAAQVPLFAFGPGAEQFTGVLDNTEISRRIAQLLGIEDFPKALPKKHATAQLPSIHMVSTSSK